MRLLFFSFSLIFVIVLIGDIMEIKIDKKRIKINKLTSWKDRFKSLMFVFEPIDTGYWFPKKSGFHTYMFCQRVDIVLVDKKMQVLYLYPHFKSEKIIFPKRHVYHVFVFPLGTCDHLNIGDKLEITDKKKEIA